MILHFHYSLSANSGDVKRISNIDREVSNLFKEETIEVVFCPLRKWNYTKKNGFFTLSENTKLKYCIPLIPRVHFLNYIYESLILTVLGFFYKPSFLIGEMMFPKFLTSIFRSVNQRTIIIADIHGAVVDENIYQNPNIGSKNLNQIKEIDRLTMQTADYIICQSAEMKKYINKNYGINTDKIVVYRCGYDSSLFFINNEKRISIRKKLAVQDDILFVYSGGLHKWQKIEDAFKIFAKYHSSNKKSKFLILTADHDKLKSLLKSYSYLEIKDSIISFSVPFKEVPDYLNASDIAFLIRDNHIMNAVASPTKLAEYMACGIPVISSKVSDFWVNKEGSHYILIDTQINGNSDIDFFINKLDKHEIESYAKESFSLKIDQQNLKKFFEKIK